jgi:mRNA interferase MazF
MRPIHVARVDKRRPVLVLTREIAVGRLTGVTVAPITSTVRGLAVEVPVGPVNGLDHDSVVNHDNVTTNPRSQLGQRIGWLLPSQEHTLSAAIRAAFDLDDPH